MSEPKFTLLQENGHFAVGQTDLKSYINRPLAAGGCTLLICTSGRAVVSINFRKQLLRQGDAVFLFSDMVFILISSSRDFSVFYCAISGELLNEAIYNTSWDFYEYLSINPICRTSEEQFTQLMLWQQQVSWFLSEPGAGQQHSFMRNSIQNLFLGVDREIKRNQVLFKQSQQKDRAWALMNRFFALLMEHCKQQRSVRFYADKLCISPYYLYKITDKMLKLSPKQIIDEQIIVEIKMQLSCTDLSIKQIAEMLHFDDPSYMCRFFRRYTRKSLSAYKSEFI